jgi:hypothetical protein
MLLLTTTTANSCILPLLHSNNKNNDDEHDKIVVAIATDDDDDSSTCSSSVGGVLGTHKPLPQKPLDDPDADSGRPPLANRMLERQQSERGKKVVRFNMNANQAHDNNTLMFHKEDCKRLWYTRRDYSDFKAANKMLAAQIARSSEQRRRSGRSATTRASSFSWSSSSSCTDEFSSCSSFSSSYQDILYRTYEACCKYPMTHPVDEADTDANSSVEFYDAAVMSSTISKSSDPVVIDESEENELRQWLDIGTARLGLERSAVRDIARDRHYRYQDLVRIVREIQQQAQAPQWKMQQQCTSRLDNDDDSYNSDEMMMMDTSSNTTAAAPSPPPIDATAQRAEYLRQACQAITRPSRLFARQLARAQAAAVVPLC